MFIGSFGGHMSRLAFELLVGFKGRVVPYFSGVCVCVVVVGFKGPVCVCVCGLLLALRGV